MYAYSSGSRLVLAVSGARPADPQQYRQLHNVVEEMAIGAGLPEAGGVRDRRPLAERVRDRHQPEQAAITATTGLLQIMNREELEGVIATR